jgi:hypothetical protein
VKGGTLPIRVKLSQLHHKMFNVNEKFILQFHPIHFSIQFLPVRDMFGKLCPKFFEVVIRNYKLPLKTISPS